MSRSIGNAGLELIKKFEGCRLVAYRCAAGVWTIGYGHTQGVKQGQTCTQKQAEKWLKEDCQKFADFVDNPSYVPVTSQLNDNQRDALISFAYNCGQNNLKTLCSGRDITAIGNAIPKYNKAGGRVLQGLVERRQAEQALFNKRCTSFDHVQLNYKAGSTYILKVDLNVRSRPSTAGSVIGSLSKGKKVKNQATTRAGEAIWMYIGLDSKGRERWICADTGSKDYVG